MKTKQLKTVFEFFKDNRNDGKFTLTESEIKERYLSWLKTKEMSWIQYYGHQTVWDFISSKDGLSSVVSDLADCTDLEDILMSVRQSLYPKDNA